MLRTTLVTTALLLATANPVPAQIGPDAEPASHEVAQQGGVLESAIRALPDESRMPLGTRHGSSRDDAVAAAEAISPGFMAGGTVRTIFALGGVIGAILLLFVGVKHVARRSGSLMAAAGPGGRAPSGVLTVLARYPIARGQTLMLIRVERRVMLVAQGTGGRGAPPVMQTLSVFDEPTDVASLMTKCADTDGASAQSAFNETLKRLTQNEPEPRRASPARQPVPGRTSNAGAPVASSAIESSTLSPAANDAVRVMRERLARLAAEGNAG